MGSYMETLKLANTLGMPGEPQNPRYCKNKDNLIYQSNSLV